MISSFISFFKMRKYKKVLFHAFAEARKKRAKIGNAEKETLIQALQNLERTIVAGNKVEAKKASVILRSKAEKILKKGPIEKGIETLLSIAIALFFALLIRQLWFELYEIPSGSMRPTFKELDRLAVSKLDFGINKPFSPDHFYFDPNRIQRMGIFVFTAENMDLKDSDTMYFYIFPGKKLLTKRLIAKPGDTLYFYGGKLYGLDAEGKDISSQLNLPSLSLIDHIPYMRLEGKPELTIGDNKNVVQSVSYYQMNQPMVKLLVGKSGKVESVYTVPASIQAKQQNASIPYQQYWGMNNYAMARLLTKKELLLNGYTSIHTLPDAPLYLELRHDPNTQNAKLVFSESGKLIPMLDVESSLLPLDIDKLRLLSSNLYTARFEVKEGIARRYGSHAAFDLKNAFLPQLHGVPNGTYEFYYGKAYEVLWQGITKELKPDHPLYQFSIERIQLFFNLGIEFSTLVSPQYQNGFYPARYAYFRDGDLFVMGAKLFAKDDPALKTFVTQELKKQELSHVQRPYFPFVDHKAPLDAEGNIDKERILLYGLHIPEKSYLALGDNHAMSADSRDFGFVPENNIKGAPHFIFWPFGNRFGAPNQPHYPIFVFSRIVIWGSALLFFTLWFFYQRRKEQLPLNYKLLSD